MTRTHRENIRSVTISKQDGSDKSIGGGAPLLLVAGPCVVEDHGLCVEIAAEASRTAAAHGMTYVFKASYDKANKTIAGSYRGPGVGEGIAALGRIKAETGALILTDVHEPEQCAEAAEVADILQIPALLSKQIDLIIAAAKTGKAVNIKKGQFTAPWEMNNVTSRLSEEGYETSIITERGYMFGYNTMINDMRALQIMSTLNRPVIFDASHSVHGNDTILTGSELKHRDFIRPLARSAAANGIDGLFLEVHPNPDDALSDAPGTLALGDLDHVLRDVVAIDAVLGGDA